MKKTFFPLIYTTVVLIISPVSVIAQKGDIAFNSAKPSKSFLSSSASSGFMPMKANNFNIRAVRDFVKTFKTVEDNRWCLSKEGGLTFTFTADGIATVVMYDKKGHREYLIRTYEESRLPADIRHRVKGEYYDAVITLVKEVETRKERVFFVHIADKDSWKIVSIANGEMKLVEEHKKG